MVNQYMQGIGVNEENLALDLINKIGPGGHYLYEDHTLAHFRDVWYSDLFDRSINDVWLEQGAKTFADRLQEKTLRLMEHQPKSLPKDVLAELETMQQHWE
jgi:trimethylamine--corrinoid protein Co-methyltransferase